MWQSCKNVSEFGIITWCNYLYYCPGNTKEQLNTDAWSWFEEERRG